MKRGDVRVEAFEKNLEDLDGELEKGEDGSYSVHLSGKEFPVKVVSGIVSQDSAYTLSEKIKPYMDKKTSIELCSHLTKDGIEKRLAASIFIIALAGVALFILFGPGGVTSFAIADVLGGNVWIRRLVVGLVVLGVIGVVWKFLIKK